MKRYMFMILAVCLIPIFAMTVAASPRSNDFGSATADNSRQKGLIFSDLKKSEKCGNGWEDAHGVCTPGPEAAPAGVDVTEIPSTQELYAEAGESIYPPCFGDGVSGKRVQAVYVVPDNAVDRYNQVAPLIQSTYAYRMNKVFSNTAASQGGTLNIRFVTGPDCKVDVAKAVVPAASLGTFSESRTALRNLGFNRTDRKYIMWTDSSYYCGIANINGDIDPLPADNSNDGGPTFGRIDASCWGNVNSVEAHELAHTIGAVQMEAPHSNGGWHCYDEYDRMCYNDGSGVPMQYICSTGDSLFDCNKDDYFSLNPAPGSWLETHWNIVNSSYLTTELGSYPAVDPTPTPTTTSATPTPTPTTSSPTPTPTKTKYPKKCEKNPTAPGCDGYVPGEASPEPEITETVVE